MARISREQLHKWIVQHYINVASTQKQITVNHFLQERIPRQTIYSIIKKYEESGYVSDKPRSGRPKKLSRGQLTRLKDQLVPTNRGFYTSDKRTTAPQIKFKRIQKFEPKVLVWIAISEKGISTPFFSKQKQVIGQITDLNQCIVAPLIPFATSHHTKGKYLDQNDVQFVHKELNLQNCPQARPIETLWPILKKMVYDEGWEAKTSNQLRRRIARKLKETDIKIVQQMFLSIRKQLRKIADTGPYEACSS
ncbi:unnamed protein product [Rotaria socialis]|uniref:Uncharacterized protein n=1 Tax=Rotaria socialis TaxID=392032 RepID=A0A817Z859_9BILA|nr:unnamed protein product [Rotaria socialis]